MLVMTQMITNIKVTHCRRTWSRRLDRHVHGHLLILNNTQCRCTIIINTRATTSLQASLATYSAAAFTCNCRYTFNIHIHVNAHNTYVHACRNTKGCWPHTMHYYQHQLLNGIATHTIYVKMHACLRKDQNTTIWCLQHLHSYVSYKTYKTYHTYIYIYTHTIPRLWRWQTTSKNRGICSLYAHLCEG